MAEQIYKLPEKVTLAVVGISHLKAIKTNLEKKGLEVIDIELSDPTTPQLINNVGKAEFLKKNPATHTINTKTENWQEKAMALITDFINDKDKKPDTKLEAAGSGTVNISNLQLQ